MRWITTNKKAVFGLLDLAQAKKQGLLLGRAKVRPSTWACGVQVVCRNICHPISKPSTRFQTWIEQA